MKRLLAVLALAVSGAVLFPPLTAFACSCAVMPGHPETPLEGTVFYGEVVRRVVDEGRATYVVRVERVYAGEVGATAEVHTAAHGASCGLELPGSGYAVLYTREEDGVLTSGLCTGSRTADAPPAGLGPGRAPTGSATPPPPPTEDGQASDGVAPVATAAVAVAGGVLATRRRRA